MGVNPRVARGNDLGILQVVVWCFWGGFRVSGDLGFRV